MSISWGNWAVRVYAAEAWVSLAARFAVEHPVIVEHVEATLDDPVPAVRLQAAQNLQVICRAAPERMWAIGERLATHERDAAIVASYLSGAMRRFSHSDPERCEAVLSIVKARLDGDFGGNKEGRDEIQECLGAWTAQLYVGQGRTLGRSWLEQWVADPERYGDLLDSFTSQLRAALFHRYRVAADENACAMCARAQEGLALVLHSASTSSAHAHSVLAANALVPERQAAIRRYQAAEKVIHHATNQLYFGSGAYADHTGDGAGLPDTASMARFLTDYAELLALIARSHEPATLHQLVELYEFLIPGDPVAVFEAIHALLLGRGEEEGYHFERLGQAAVVRIVQRYIADYRSIFDEEDRRGRLVRILQLFSDVGWPDALKLLYALPDLLR